MPQSQRTYCVVWTTKEVKSVAFDHNTFDTFTDHSKFFEEEDVEVAKTFYEDLLKEEDTYCASLCKVLEDSEG